MRPLRLAALLAAQIAVVGAFALVFAAPSTDARTNTRSKPVIFIHGSDWFAPYGVDCPRSFAIMKSRLRDFGWTGPLVAVSYYGHDTRCDASIGSHGSHSVHYASGHDSNGGHTGNTNIRHLGYHLAWYIYDRFTSKGIAVDVVGHSMGPLMIQYALAQVELHHPAFPPRLLVEDVVSLAGPFAGAKSIINTCHTTQCAEMRAGSDFLAWLRANAWEPDGQGGTDWTAVSSADDNYVSAGSGTAMGACHKVIYLSSSNVEHIDLLHDGAQAVTADVERKDCPGSWTMDRTYWWPVRATDMALTYGGR
jgi:hypothetical protein